MHIGVKLNSRTQNLYAKFELNNHRWYFKCFLTLQTVSKDLSEPVRSRKDFDKEAAPHFHKAVKFYKNLSKQLVSERHALDLFASALDQETFETFVCGMLSRLGGVLGNN
ncbi:hypothetical protein Scep_011110 [Stephania cephalantha]|uniref:Protein transport protein SEC23 n=1 Tax=Stephania cephalantha TaxID=152367 RepID=A0AAP0PFY5_9MAGN